MNAGYELLTNWDDPPRRMERATFNVETILLSIESWLFHRDTCSISYGFLLKPPRNWVVSHPLCIP